MLKRREIAVDLDDTLSYMMDHFVEVYNEESGDHVTLDSFKTWDMAKYVLPEWQEKATTYFTRPGWFSQIKPREDAQRVLAELAKVHNIYIVTAFQPRACPDKMEWLAKNFPFIHWRNIIFCNCKEKIDAHYLIDDGLHNLQHFKGIPIVFDKPWNRDDAAFVNTFGRSLYRVINWDELAAYNF